MLCNIARRNMKGENFRLCDLRRNIGCDYHVALLGTFIPWSHHTPLLKKESPQQSWGPSTCRSLDRLAHIPFLFEGCLSYFKGSRVQILFLYHSRVLNVFSRDATTSFQFPALPNWNIYPAFPVLVEDLKTVII